MKILSVHIKNKAINVKKNVIKRFGTLFIHVFKFSRVFVNQLTREFIQSFSIFSRFFLSSSGIPSTKALLFVKLLTMFFVLSKYVDLPSRRLFASLKRVLLPHPIIAKRINKVMPIITIELTILVHLNFFISHLIIGSSSKAKTSAIKKGK